MKFGLEVSKSFTYKSVTEKQTGGQGKNHTPYRSKGDIIMAILHLLIFKNEHSTAE